MNGPAIAIVLSSTAMHAGWNLLARRQRDEGRFILHMLLWSSLIGLPVAGASEWWARSMTPTAWWCLLASGACCGVYYWGLAWAYVRSDFTVVYPLARALPVLVLAVTDMARGRALSAGGWAGCVLVGAGCLLAPLTSLRQLSVRHYVNDASIWIALTALGTVGYTLLDKVAAESLNQPGLATALRYGVFFFAISLVVYAPLSATVPRPAGPRPRLGWMVPLVAGALNYGAYALVLWAYQLTLHASYVVAFRQFSIVLGVVLAFVLYREQGVAVRLAGSLLITAGLVFIGLSG